MAAAATVAPWGGVGARRGAWGAWAWGGGEKPQKTLHSRDRQYKAPKDYTKRRQNIESPKAIIQSPEILDKTQNIRQSLKYQTRVATNICLAYNQNKSNSKKHIHYL